jgi:hypothetical protein
MAADTTMELARQTGLRISAPAALPATLQGATERQTIEKIHALMLDVEELLNAACHAMQRLHPGNTDLQASVLASELPRCPAVVAMTARHLTGLSEVEALSIALRLWAGLLDAAKIIRKEKVIDDMTGATADIMAQERTDWMIDLHYRKAVFDPVYAAGAKVAPFAKRHKREEVFYEGVPTDLQPIYFLDDIYEHPSTPGAVAPPPRVSTP